MARVPKKHPIMTHKAPVVQIYAQDQKNDAMKGIKEGSPQDLAIDAKKGIKD